MSQRTQLLTRKRDLFAALRTLEDDLRDGTVDHAMYEAARSRYEQEAAEIVRALEALPADAGVEADRTTGTRLAPWLVAGAGLLVALALAVFLLAATHHRTEGGVVTGSGGGTPLPATPSPQLAAAEQKALAHPRSYQVLLALGNADINSGDTASALAAYRRAESLQPRRPEAPTLRAMILAADGHGTQALALLHHVERTNPSYARAYLLEGMIAARTPHGRVEAVAAWHTFLRLDPRGKVAATVRSWLAAPKTRATPSSRP